MEQINFEQELILEELNEQNVAEIHDFCEKNVDRWSQSLYFFRKASLGDTSFNPRLTIIARNKSSHEIIAFFQGTTRKSLPFYQHGKLIKFCVVARKYQRKGVGTWMLHQLFARFKELGYKGKIGVFASTPDYWFPGIATFHTSALYWLKKNGFRGNRLGIDPFRQNLIVNFSDPNLPIKISEQPPTEKSNFRFQRITPEYFDKTYNFVKTHHGLGSWPAEVKLTFENNPPTTYIAIDKNTDEVVGWASHNAYFGGSFGPTGVLKSLRGQGIGGILFRWTQYDLYQMGYKQCRIMWVTGNTVKYYSKVAGAYIAEIYWVLTGKIV